MVATTLYRAPLRGLGSVALNPGRTILLRMKTDGTLLASSEGKLLAESKSHTLCRAVQDDSGNGHVGQALGGVSFVEGKAFRGPLFGRRTQC